MKRPIKATAFSFLELSIVIIIIGVLIAGVVTGKSLIYKARLNTARSLSETSPVVRTPDLILWMDATKEGSLTNADSSTNVEEGDFIDIWRDINPQQTTSKLVFTAPSSDQRPIYRQTGLNGLPTLEFDGLEELEDLNKADYLASPEVPRTRQPNNHTIFAVFSPLSGNNSAPQGVFVKKGVGSNNTPYSINYNGDTNRTGSIVNSSSLSFVTNNNNATIGSFKPVIVTVTHEADNVSDGFNVYINGGNVSTQDAKESLYASGQELRIGRQKDMAGRSCKCLISEIIMFDRILEDDRRNKIEEYLGQKWQIKLEL